MTVCLKNICAELSLWKTLPMLILGTLCSGRTRLGIQDLRCGWRSGFLTHQPIQRYVYHFACATHIFGTATRERICRLTSSRSQLYLGYVNLWTRDKFAPTLKRKDNISKRRSAMDNCFLIQGTSEMTQRSRKDNCHSLSTTMKN